MSSIVVGVFLILLASVAIPLIDWAAYRAGVVAGFYAARYPERRGIVAPRAVAILEGLELLDDQEPIDT